MAWRLLFAAGVVEIVMAAAFEVADGWTRLVSGTIGIASALVSIFLLTHVIKHLPTGTTCAVRTGIGAAVRRMDAARELLRRTGRTASGYRWSLMVASLLLAASCARGSYGAPAAVPASNTMSISFSGLPHELPEIVNSAPSTMIPLVL